MAARLVLKDWNKGKIPYYSTPPDAKLGMATGMDTKVVSSFSDEFDVNKILKEHDAEARVRTLFFEDAALRRALPLGAVLYRSR